MEHKEHKLKYLILVKQMNWRLVLELEPCMLRSLLRKKKHVWSDAKTTQVGSQRCKFWPKKRKSEKLSGTHHKRMKQSI